MDEKDLKQMVDQGLSNYQISSRTGKCYSSVRHWMKKYGIATKRALAMRNRIRRWKDEDLIEAVKSSKTIADVLRSLGLDPRGANYRLIKRHIERLKLNTDHFIGQAHCKGKPSGGGRSLSDLLVKNSPVMSNGNLKVRVINAGLLEQKCQVCRMEPVWNDKKLVLRLDHINGDHRDNRIENLRLVCPNCDSQLPTFCSRNRVALVPDSKPGYAGSTPAGSIDEQPSG